MTLAPGTRLGPYEIVVPLGAGGMGEVYKAHDTRLERDVALKVLPAEALGDEMARARLVREARLASRLNHPHICTIHDVGESEGQTYIAMELVEGQALSSRLAEGPLTIDQVLRYGQQMADALAHAHTRGVVHRDFKSANVVVTPEGQVKVLDFGLAKRLTDEQLADVTTVRQHSLTEPETVAGTLAYMAPEQLRGQPADERSDIWALGVVLYEMATGQRPFQGQTGFELTSAVLKEVPPPLPSSVPAPLSGVIEHCLVKEPGERCQRSSEVQAALETVLTGGVLPRWRPAARVRARARWLTAAGLVALVVVSAVLDLGGVRSWLWSRVGTPVHAVKLAVLPFENRTGDPEQEYFSDGMTDEMIAQLGRLHPQGLLVTARTSVMRYKNSDKPPDQIARELGVAYLLEGSARREAGRIRISAALIQAENQTQLWADSFERELSGILALQSDVAREVARKIDIALTPEQERSLAGARSVNPEVYESYLRGMYYVAQRSPEGFEKGMPYLHRAVEIDPAEPLAYAGLAAGYVTLGHGGALDQPDAFPRAKAAAEQALKLQPDMPEAVGFLADVALYYEWDWTRAEELFTRALALNPSVASTQYHHAWYLALVNRLDEAIAAHKRARDLDPLVPGNTGWLGQLYNYAGRYDEAIVEAKRALELNPQFTPSFRVLRFAYAANGAHEDAIAAAQRYAEVDPVRGNANLSIAYAQAGQREQALSALSRMPKHTPGLHIVAAAYLAIGDTDAAIEELEASYKAREPTLPWVRVHGSEFDALRDDPRFQDLLRRLNLPQ
jgi:eukaryotic-like serine/threonine-protein kinase